ncbi:MAG TPA: acyltransferase [Anaerolineales bacterium]|jgi:surface polysaccharide O-acyltransferase-like enzyme
MKPRNLTIDTLRLLAALEVVILHVHFDHLPDLVAIALRLQARWAVPFFMIVGGYYLARRLAEPDRSDARPWIYRMMWIFGLWTLIYVPLVLIEHGPKEVFRRLLFSTFIYTGTYFHLWFPSSLALGALVLLFCFHYKLGRLLPFVSLAIMVHILLAGSYDIFGIKFPFEFETARHWVSVPLLYLGFWLFRRGPLRPPLAFLLLVGGLALQAAEAYYLLTRFQVPAYDHEILIGTFPFALGAASLGLSGMRLLELPVLSNWGREYSLGIYLLHAWVFFAIEKSTAPLGREVIQSPLWEIGYPFLILLACIALLAVLRKWTPGFFNWLLGSYL